MAGPVAFEMSTTLNAPAGEVWARVSTMDGVNDELLPWIRMTHPSTLTDLRTAPPEMIGRTAFRSVLLAGGIVPIDLHSLRLVSVEDREDGEDRDGVGDEGGGSFVEESTTLLQRRWRHERDVDPVDDDNCVVTDRLLVEPRLPFARPIVARVVPWLFGHRHRVLTDRYGLGA